MKIPFHSRFQIEIGGRWQLLPNGELTWREWAFSPWVGFAYPGRLIRRQDVPREMWKPILVGNYENGRAPAKFWWASIALRLLGLDLGLAVFYSPVNKVEGLNS